MRQSRDGEADARGPSDREKTRVRGLRERTGLLGFWRGRGKRWLERGRLEGRWAGWEGSKLGRGEREKEGAGWAGLLGWVGFGWVGFGLRFSFLFSICYRGTEYYPVGMKTHIE